jgi:hypothetical protein
VGGSVINGPNSSLSFNGLLLAVREVPNEPAAYGIVARMDDDVGVV